MPKEYLDKAGLKRLIELLKVELTKLESYTDNAVTQLRDEIENLESIAKGAVGGETFMTYEELVNELNSADNTAFYQGQHMLIKTIGVPDVWVYEVSDTNVPYTYTDDETLAKAVTETTVQVGYYVLSALETQKVVLADYMKKPTIANAVSVTDANGKVMEMKYTNAATGDTIMYRDGNGRTNVHDPVSDYHAANKLWTETNFVPHKKTSGLMKVYGNDTNGEVQMFTIRQPGQATADAHIPQTDANGVLHAVTPTVDDNGTSLVTKEYIDGWELINKVTLTEEAKSIRCETDSNGNEFLLKKVVFIVRSQPSTAATGSAVLYYCVSTAKTRKQSSTVHQIGELGAGLRTTAQENAAYVEQKFYIPSGRVEGQGLVILSVSGGDNGSLKSKYLTRDIRPNNDEQHITCAYVESGSDTTIFGVGSELEIWGVRA